MATTVTGYDPIRDLYGEICKAQDAGALMAALVMVYVGIDTMAWLSLPIGSSRVKKKNFCEWVDAFLRTDASQPYQYRGLDVYAARCAMLHSYGSLADLHRQPNSPKTFGYLDNGPHRADGLPLVLISIAVLIRDFGAAVTAFLQEALRNRELKACIDSRMDALVSVLPVLN